VRVRAHADRTARADIKIGGGHVPPGNYRLTGRAQMMPEADGAPAPATSLLLRFDAPGGAVTSTTLTTDAPAATVSGNVHHPGGALQLKVSLRRLPPGAPTHSDVWITGVALTRLPADGTL
jgi:hypothetical protein